MKKQWSLWSQGKSLIPCEVSNSKISSDHACTRKTFLYFGLPRRNMTKDEERKTHVENLHAISCLLSKCNKYMTMAYIYIYDLKPLPTKYFPNTHGATFSHSAQLPVPLLGLDLFHRHRTRPLMPHPKRRDESSMAKQARNGFTVVPRRGKPGKGGTACCLVRWLLCHPRLPSHFAVHCEELCVRLDVL